MGCDVAKAGVIQLIYLYGVSKKVMWLRGWFCFVGGIVYPSGSLVQLNGGMVMQRVGVV
jgi:hypothetical protein